jgi:prophage DNA circulation protein
VRLYPDYWEQWKPLLLSGAAGDLRHPILGPMRARVENAKFELKASVRSGIIVDVSWIETVENPANALDLADISYQLPAAQLAAKADAAAAAFDVYPAQDLPPELVAVRYGVTFAAGVTTTTLADIFAAIRPDIFVGTLRALSLLTSLQADVATMVDVIQALDTVFSYAALDALQAFYLALFDMRAGLSRTARSTGAYVPSGRTTLDAVAYKVGNSVREVMGLNIPLLRLSYVERGTPVTYFKAP